jgi:hypothetical protein
LDPEKIHEKFRFFGLLFELKQLILEIELGKEG